MDVADKPHLVRLVETIRYLENVYISEVDYKSSIPPIYCANTFVFVGQNIPLVNLPVVLVFQPRVLADGVGIDLYASIVAENMRFASVYENNTSINLLPIIYTLASEFNLSHSFSVFITLN